MFKRGDMVVRKVSEYGDIGRVVWVDNASKFSQVVVKFQHLDCGDGHGAYSYKSGFPVSELVSYLQVGN